MWLLRMLVVDEWCSVKTKIVLILIRYKLFVANTHMFRAALAIHDACFLCKFAAATSSLTLSILRSRPYRNKPIDLLYKVFKNGPSKICGK